MVPPMWVVDPSGMKTTTGWGVAGSISVELAPSKPSTFLANSMTATCMPRQMPKKGLLFSLAYLQVAALPATPLPPKPPGTRMPSHSSIALHALSYLCRVSSASFVSSSKSEASIHEIFSFLFAAMAACCNDFITLK